MPVAEMTAAAAGGAALTADISAGEGKHERAAPAHQHGLSLSAAGLSTGNMPLPRTHKHDAAEPAVLEFSAPPGHSSEAEVAGKTAKSAAALADAAALVTSRPSRLTGAPVTTPSVVKTKAGRRGAIGPLLSRLRAESENAASGTLAEGHEM